MGNCLVPQEGKVIKIVRLVDGEILRFPSPVRVQQVLDEFPRHAIAGKLDPAAAAAAAATRYLDPATLLQHGQLYYLLLPPPPPPQKVPAIEERGGGGGSIRVKVVLSKQELKELLSKGEVSHGDMVALLRREGRCRSEKERRVEWKPTLERIPEGSDFS